MSSGQGGRTPKVAWLDGRVAMLILLLAALALRLVALERQDIWWDEARNIEVALRPFAQVAWAPELDIHPPLYFWMLHAWLRWTDAQMGMPPEQMAWLARWLSVAAGVVGVALLYRLASRIGPTGSGVAAASLGAFSAFWLAESQETRMYTVGFAWLTAAAVMWLRAQPTAAGAADAQGRGRWLVAFVLLSVAALMTHYNAVFVLAAWYAAWAFMVLVGPRRWVGLRVPALCGVATAVLVAPIAPIALRQIPDYANPNLVVPSIVEYLAQNWRAYWAGYAYDAGWAYGLGGWWLWLAVAIVGMAVAALATTRLSAAKVWVATWLVLGLALYYVAVLDRGAFNVRYSSFVTPALYALAGAGLAQMVARRRWLAMLVLVSVVLWPLAIERDVNDERFAREDISGVTAWLIERAGPEDVILVDQKYPFGFYYERYSTALETEPVGRETAPARYLFVDINTVDAQLTQWVSNAQRVFWVQWFESDTDPRRAVAFLLDQAGTRGEKAWFRGYSVDTWELQPPAAFSLAQGLQPHVVSFPPAVQTVAVAVPQGEVVPGGYVPVVIRWQRVAGGVVERDLKARVALYDAAGGRIAQRDERLLNDRHLLPAEWGMADQPLNVYLLTVPEDAAAGMLEIGLLVYDGVTLEPLGVVDGAGNHAGVEVILATVTVRVERPPGMEGDRP